jgi:hypothetical protein
MITYPPAILFSSLSSSCKVLYLLQYNLVSSYNFLSSISLSTLISLSVPSYQSYFMILFLILQSCPPSLVSALASWLPFGSYLSLPCCISTTPLFLPFPGCLIMCFLSLCLSLVCPLHHLFHRSMNHHCCFSDLRL